jgi:hypothetical protein
MNESMKWNLGYARERKKKERELWIEKTLMLYGVLVDSFEVTQNTYILSVKEKKT